MDERDKELVPSTRQNILGLLDSFIDNIHKIRKIMLGMSISAIILAPLAISLSVYLIIHPSFFEVHKSESEFAVVLSILLGAVILISSVWLFTGIKQYRSMSTWKNSYESYIKEKDELDRRISSQFGLENE